MLYGSKLFCTNLQHYGWHKCEQICTLELKKAADDNNQQIFIIE
jgi:hypothetical protein